VQISGLEKETSFPSLSIVQRNEENTQTFHRNYGTSTPGAKPFFSLPSFSLCLSREQSHLGFDHRPLPPHPRTRSEPMLKLPPLTPNHPTAAASPPYPSCSVSSLRVPNCLGSPPLGPTRRGAADLARPLDQPPDSSAQELVPVDLFAMFFLLLVYKGIDIAHLISQNP
jgi:hypothetical protein